MRSLHISVVSWTIRVALGMALALPVAAQRVPQPVPDPKPGGGFFGVSVSNVGKLVLVTTVYRGTAAETLARPGDLVLLHDGKPVVSTQTLIARIGAQPPGTPLTLRVLRDGAEVEIKAKLGKRTSDVMDPATALTPTPDQTALIKVLSDNPGRADLRGRALTALRTGSAPLARRWLEIQRVLIEAELAAGPTPAMRPVLTREGVATGWLLRAVRAGAVVPINDGRPPRRPDAERDARIARLIGELGHATFAGREAAMKGLRAIGAPALPALTAAAAATTNLEVRWRVRRLLEQLERQRKSQRERVGVAVFRIDGPADGDGWRLVRELGPPLSRGARYQALAFGRDAKAAPRPASFLARGPLEVTLSGDSAAAGQRLLLLIEVPAAGQ